MKTKKILYIPFLAVFLFSLAVLVAQYSNFSNFIDLDPPACRLPFNYSRVITNIRGTGTVLKRATGTGWVGTAQEHDDDRRQGFVRI